MAKIRNRGEASAEPDDRQRKFYDELPLFEKEWHDYTNSPFVKAHMNGSSALTSMYFALDLEPGSEIMVPSYPFFSTCLALRFLRLCTCVRGHRSHDSLL